MWTPEQVERHNKCYQRGFDLIEGLVLIDGKPRPVIGRAEESRLNEAISQFEEALKINEKNTGCMMMMGKIYQVLKRHDLALQWFSRACSTEPSNHIAFREASIAAMELEKYNEAHYYAYSAVKLKPNNASLLCNLSLVLLFLGRLDPALDALRQALFYDPNDDISKKLYYVIERIKLQKLPIPKNHKELSKY